MLSLFKKKRGKESVNTPHQCSIWVDKKLRVFATLLNQKTEGLPINVIIALAVSISFLFSLLLVFRVKETLHTKTYLRVQKMRAPIVPRTVFHSEEDILYGRIRKFESYLDSLKRNDEPSYDSLVKVRPQLMDSLIKVEALINQ